MKIEKFGGGVMVLEDGTELLYTYSVWRVLNNIRGVEWAIWKKSFEVVESLRTVRCDSKDTKGLGQKREDKDS